MKTIFALLILIFAMETVAFTDTEERVRLTDGSEVATTYNDKGIKIKEVVYSKINNAEAVTVTTLYDSNGKKKEVKTFIRAGFSTKTTTDTYNDQGIKTKTVIVEDSGRESTTRLYEYDNNGILIRSNSFLGRSQMEAAIASILNAPPAGTYNAPTLQSYSITPLDNGPGYRVGEETNIPTVKQKEPLYEETSPLFAAVRREDIKEVERLIGIDGAVNVTDSIGETPLFEAVNKNNSAIIEILLSNKADINARNKAGWTALYYAVLKGNVEMVKLLLEKGTDKGIPDNNKNTPKQIADKKGFTEIAKLLDNYKEDTVLSNTAETNAQAAGKISPSGSSITLARIEATPGMLNAVKNGNVEEVKKLLYVAPIQANAEDSNCWSVLHLAVFSNKKEVVDLLLEKGADVNKKVPGGYTPLDYALGYEHKEIAEILRSKGGVEGKKLFSREQPDIPGKIQPSKGNDVAAKKEIIAMIPPLDEAVQYENYVEPESVKTYQGSLSDIIVEHSIPFVPLGPICDWLKIPIEKGSKSITLISNSSSKIVLNIGSNKAIINGAVVNLQSNPVIRKGKIYVPLDLLEEGFDNIIARWSDKEKIVSLINTDTGVIVELQTMKPLKKDILEREEVFVIPKIAPDSDVTKIEKEFKLFKGKPKEIIARLVSEIREANKRYIRYAAMSRNIEDSAYASIFEGINDNEMLQRANYYEAIRDVKTYQLGLCLQKMGDRQGYIREIKKVYISQGDRKPLGRAAEKRLENTEISQIENDIKSVKGEPKTIIAALQADIVEMERKQNVYKNRAAYLKRDAETCKELGDYEKSIDFLGEEINALDQALYYLNIRDVRIYQLGIILQSIGDQEGYIRELKRVHESQMGLTPLGKVARKRLAAAGAW